MKEESITSKINKMSKEDSAKLALSVAVFLGLTTWKDVIDKALENGEEMMRNNDKRKRPKKHPLEDLIKTNKHYNYEVQNRRCSKAEKRRGTDEVRQLVQRIC